MDEPAEEVARTPGGWPTYLRDSGDAAVDEDVVRIVPPEAWIGPVHTGSAEVLLDHGLLAARPWQLLVKRSVDVALTTLLLVLLSPVLLVVSVAIAVTSRGPILHVQERIGRDGRPFPMLKFRSMHVNAHEDRDRLEHHNEASGPVFKIRDDPRVTGVGRIIRRLSLDELPQLLNVLNGDMSLVGPRPPLPEEYETYDARERLRVSVTPGVTCIWQVSGRSDLDFETWVAMDLEYIRDWTLRMDLALLLRTVPAVLSARGAY